MVYDSQRLPGSRVLVEAGLSAHRHYPHHLRWRDAQETRLSHLLHLRHGRVDHSRVRASEDGRERVSGGTAEREGSRVLAGHHHSLFAGVWVFDGFVYVHGRSSLQLYEGKEGAPVESPPLC